MKLYYAPGACSLAVHNVAREADIPLDLAKVDLARHRTDTGADLATINPKNAVPALALDNGEVLTEAAVILQWLAERAGRSDLLPAAGTMGRYRVLEWLNFVATELHKSFSPWLWHSDTAEPTKKAVHAKLALRFGHMEERLGATEKHLRPGNTVSGPALFTLADIGGYVCVLSHAGPDALSVTTNLNINFMRKAEPGPIDGHCRILKLGRSLMVFDVSMVAGPECEVVAHATGTYSIPPKRS